MKRDKADRPEREAGPPPGQRCSAPLWGIAMVYLGASTSMALVAVRAENCGRYMSLDDGRRMRVDARRHGPHHIGRDLFRARCRHCGRKAAVKAVVAELDMGGTGLAQPLRNSPVQPIRRGAELSISNPAGSRSVMTTCDGQLFSSVKRSTTR